jgi:hypothetical protein
VPRFQGANQVGNLASPVFVSLVGCRSKVRTWKSLHETEEVFRYNRYLSSVLHLGYHFSNQWILDVCYASSEPDHGDYACGVAFEMRNELFGCFE